MKILGISCDYHDSSATLVIDGRVVSAMQEERFSRIKHDASFPEKAVAFCLKESGLMASDLDFAVFYEKPFRKLERILKTAVSFYPKTYALFREGIRVYLTKKLWIKDNIAQKIGIKENKILFVPHHLSHAASAFYPSSFEKATILTVDGVGEWTTAAWGLGEKNKIRLIKEIRFPQSLGLLYSAFTAFLGFEVNEGEWKVMGLAPYGKPIFRDKILKTVSSNKDGSFSLDLSYFSFHYSDSRSFSNKFVREFGSPISPETSHIITQKAADIAASIQSVTEDILVNMASALKKQTGLDNLCLAGGVFLNSSANWKILKNTGFKNIFIQPAAGDAGGSLGAALYVSHCLNKEKRHPQTAFLGKSYSNNNIKNFLDLKKVKYRYLPYAKLTDFTASAIANGKVIGWMQGRAEWGPRALGARSILADPRNPEMKDIINSKIKFREAFRPFAPSVLIESAGKVFKLPRDYKNHSPLQYMLYVVPVKKEWQKKVPAVNHKDNTARPQLVYQKDNPQYYSLIEKFYKLTGVPLLLNTSFNLRGEPIVDSPKDAYSTFIRSGIDLLVMGNYIIEK